MADWLATRAKLAMNSFKKVVAMYFGVFKIQGKKFNTRRGAYFEGLCINPELWQWLCNGGLLKVGRSS